MYRLVFVAILLVGYVHAIEYGGTLKPTIFFAASIGVIQL